jgi:hypothetical protein
MMIGEVLTVATAFAQHGDAHRKKERMGIARRFNRWERLMVAGPAAIVVTQGSAIALLAPAMSAGRTAESRQVARSTRIPDWG